MFAAPIAWLLGNRWLWWLGAAIVAVAVYFGWRAHQRGVGAAKVKEQLRKEAEDGRRKMDEAGDRYRRDGGARKRLRDADF